MTWMNGGLALVSGVIVLALGSWTYWRFQKPKPAPTRVRMEAKPGVSTIEFVRDGRVVASVVLNSIIMDSRHGATAEFVDLSHYIADRRYFTEGRG